MFFAYYSGFSALFKTDTNYSLFKNRVKGENLLIKIAEIRLILATKYYSTKSSGSLICLRAASLETSPAE